MASDAATISSACISASISPLGAELQTLRDEAGRDLLWDGDPAVWRGRAPILFPIIGMLEGGQYRFDGRSYAMPKHGFARHSTFETVELKADAATYRLAASDETRAVYPFEFRLDVRFAVVDDLVTVTAAVANLGDTPMPASFGFHPAFRWPLPYGQPRSAHSIRFERAEPSPIRRIDGDGLLLARAQPSPVEGDRLMLRDDLFVADALIFDGLASRQVGYGAPVGPRLEIAFADFPTLGVWTKPGANFICIEPWQGCADPVGFDGDIRHKPGIIEIQAGDVKRLAMSIRLVKPPG